MNRTMMLAAGAAMIAAGSAFAGPSFFIEQTQFFGPQTPNFTANLTFNQFNNIANPLWVLKSITIKANLSIEGGLLELDNDGDDAASGNATLGATLNLTSGDVSLVNSMLQPVIGELAAQNGTAFNLGGTTGDPVGVFNNTGDVDYFSFEGSPASAMGSGLIGQIAWLGYIGTGTFNIDAVVNQVFDFGAIGGISFAGSPVTASGDVTVIFEYNLIPAPGVLAMLAVGGLVRSRRRHA